MPVIKITDDRYSRRLRIGHNGDFYTLPVGYPVAVPKGLMGVLTDSSIEYELVGGGGGSAGVAEPSPITAGNPEEGSFPRPEEINDAKPEDIDAESEDGLPPRPGEINPAGGDLGRAGSLTSDHDLSLLDGSIADAADNLPDDLAHLDALRAAEVNGKSRVGMLAAIDEKRASLGQQ